MSKAKSKRVSNYEKSRDIDDKASGVVLFKIRDLRNNRISYRLKISPTLSRCFYRISEEDARANFYEAARQFAPIELKQAA